MCLLQNFQIGCGTYPVSCSKSTGVFSRGYVVRDVELRTGLRLVARIRMNGVIPPLPLCALTEWRDKTLPFLTERGHRQSQPDELNIGT
jgi:hypothetical protein